LTPISAAMSSALSNSFSVDRATVPLSAPSKAFLSLAYCTGFPPGFIHFA
jgi:hypothetical protein